MKIKVADYIADFLYEHGFDSVFSVTGGGAMHLNDALGHKDGLSCMYNHHEQACAIAAEGYARQKGKAAVVCVTSGPGGTNALTGVMGSWVDSIPMFVLSGQVKFVTTIKSVPELELRQLGDQEYNITDCASAMTKYCVMVTEPDEIKYHLEKALFIMNDRRPGPVWLDIPLNVQAAIIETNCLKSFDPNEISYKYSFDTFTSDDASVLLSDLKNAKRPVIMGGTAIDNVGYGGRFLEFCERLNIPVVTAWNAHDLIPDDHKLYAGRPGTVGTRGGNFVVQNSDLLLVIGSQLNIRQISYNYENFAKNAKLYLVDFDRNEIEKPTINPYKKYCVDLRLFLDVCLESKNFCASPKAEWINYCKEVNQYFQTSCEGRKCENGRVNPYTFINKLSKKFDADDSIVCGNGSACVVTFQTAVVKKGQRMWTNSGCASMGYGLPAAIGCAVARQGKRIICFEGDGSLQMNIQELITVSHYCLNMKIIVINNDGYHSIRQTQKNLFKHHEMCGVNCKNGVAFPPLDKIAYAYSIPYYKADKMSDLDSSVNEFLNSEGFAILEIMADPEQNFEPKLSAKILPDGKIVSPSLEDMYPFLDREEYDKFIIKD
ncbi:thiamine pyrophosphate-binding protein [bacterium]|nr:thiamine pyrophosphate-binding protein [bacterium]